MDLRSSGPTAVGTAVTTVSIDHMTASADPVGPLASSAGDDRHARRARARRQMIRRRRCVGAITLIAVFGALGLWISSLSGAPHLARPTSAASAGSFLRPQAL